MVPIYNLPGISQLTLRFPLRKLVTLHSRSTLAAIFAGEVNEWYDQMILDDNVDNPDTTAYLTSLAGKNSSETIKVVVRTEGSGLTSIFFKQQALQLFLQLHFPSLILLYGNGIVRPIGRIPPKLSMWTFSKAVGIPAYSTRLWIHPFP